MITDKQMIKAFNTLINGCKFRECGNCILNKKCDDLFYVYGNFKDLMEIK